MATRRAGRGAAAAGTTPTEQATTRRRMRNRTAFQASAPIAAIWLAWLLGIAAVLVAARVGGVIGPEHGRVGGPLWPLWSWDVDLYRYVARHWYTPDRVDPTYAFFPLWPAVLRAARPVSDWVVPELIVVCA